MSLRSSTGTWVVESGPTLVGPFDGRSPATQFLTQLRRLQPGVKARAHRLHTPADALRWAERTAR